MTTKPPENRMKEIVDIHRLELLAENSLKKQDLYSALESYQQVLSLKIKLKNKIGQARTLNSIGKLCYKLGDYQAGRQYHRELIVLLNKLNSSKIKMNFYHDLIEFYQNMGDFDTVKEIEKNLRSLH